MPILTISAVLVLTGLAFVYTRLFLSHKLLKAELAERIEELGNIKESMFNMLSQHDESTEKADAHSKLFTGVLNSIPHGIFWKTRKLTYLGCNKSFVKIAGLEEDQQITGKTDDDLPWKKEEANFLKKYDCKVMEEGIPLLDMEENHIAPTGDEVTLLTNRVPLKDSSGYIIGMLGVFSDITDRKTYEKQRMQSQKMESVGHLAAGVAHEINNPLGVILGFSQNVAKRIPPGDPLEMPLKSIEREAIRCKNLVQDLLTFSRVGKTGKEPVDVKETIEGALSVVASHCKVKNVDLSQEFVEVTKIIANKSNIQQIIVNLCNNAIDAMPAGGKLILRLRNAKDRGLDGIEIQVEDTGQGMSAEVQAKIFNPFFTTKEVGKGTGLGLSLVHEIVQKHNGKISVNSEAGKGTIFYVFLPLAS